MTPLALPRSAKSLCDTVEIFERKRALEYLKQGIAKKEKESGNNDNLIIFTTLLVTDLSLGLKPPVPELYTGYIEILPLFSRFRLCWSI